MDLQHFDLNLLLALDALLKERHVTRAAARVGLSQPAMSNALARLRDLLQDPVLVRTPRGMVATPRAERLEGPLHEALQAIGRALGDAQGFEPGTARGTFDVMTSDAIAMLILPGLIARVHRQAPGIDLRVHALGEETPRSALEEGRIELLLGVYGEPGPGVHVAPLYEEHFVCLVRQGHPEVPGSLTLARYLALPHVLIGTNRIGMGASIVDRALEELGLARRVGVWMPHFLVAPFVVASSNHVLTFPSRVADAFARVLPLQVLEPPLVLPTYSICLYWHDRSHQEPSSAWLREQVLEEAKLLQAS